MNKQIDEKTCKDCLHYEVCMYVNAKAVEFARAENCKLFADTKDYRKIPTNDWLTKGISEEQLEREKQESLDEFAERNGYCKASEIFEAIEKLFRQRFSDEVDGEYRINAQEFAELKKKYESEGG